MSATVPPTTFRDSTGHPVEWKPGQLTVFSFCALWCDTWKTQVARLEEVSGRVRGLPVAIHSVSIDGRWMDVPRKQWISLADPGGQWSKALGVDRVPTTIVVDPQGVIRWSHSGVVRSDDLVHAIQTANRPSGGRIYLTFDDFPSLSGDAELFDILRREDVNATFFCLGSRMASQRELILAAKQAGHAFGCHSWDHNAETPQLDRCHETFLALLGQKDFLYRPPGGEAILGLETKLPIINPYDDTRPGISELVRRIVQAARPNAVIQLHAGVRDTVEALPIIIQSLRKRGFIFATLP